MTFNDILNKYITLIECTSKELAKTSSLSESIISRYRNGNRIPNDTNLKKLSKALEELSNNKYSNKDILNEFYKSTDNYNYDFDVIKNNLNELIEYFNINARELAKFLNFDASYLSRIRNGNRVPHNKQEFINSLSNFILKKYNNNNLCLLIKCSNKEINLNKVKEWILNNKSINTKEIDNFLQKLDDFNLNDFIKAIKFDKLKVPSIPFYKVKNKNYYGIEEMKKGELNFFKGTVLSKSKEDIFMCSDMPMEDMAKDIEFGKKWMFAIAMSLKKGLHLNIIHNIDRPFNEMMLGLESWIPIYMTGQVSPFYLKEVKKSVYNHLNYVSGSVALTGECIKGYHNKGKYYITNNTKEIEYYKQKSELLLKKANPLMNIYKENNINEFQTFLLQDKDIKSNRKRYLSSLPLFTISNKLLLNILEKNKLSKTDIDKILKYKKEEEKHIKTILKTNHINDNIYVENKSQFNNDKISLSLENIFYDKKIIYSYDEYLEHLNQTKEYTKKNNNYSITINKDRTFKNITITILENEYVIISKSANPIIHFVIRHPKLTDAISKFNPLVKE